MSGHDAWDRARDRLADRPLTEPSARHYPPDRPGYEAALAAHAQALACEESRYADPLTGAHVMTAVGHARRGWCCHLWCRHCPFQE